jgi:hypothetical protein
VRLSPPVIAGVRLPTDDPVFRSGLTAAGHPGSDQLAQRRPETPVRLSPPVISGARLPTDDPVFRSEGTAAGHPGCDQLAQRRPDTPVRLSPPVISGVRLPTDDPIFRSGVTAAGHPGSDQLLAPVRIFAEWSDRRRSPRKEPSVTQLTLSACSRGSGVATASGNPRAD